METYNNYRNDYRNYKRIIVGKEIKTKTELEYRSELIKKIFDWLTYKLYKLHWEQVKNHSIHIQEKQPTQW